MIKIVAGSLLMALPFIATLAWVWKEGGISAALWVVGLTAAIVGCVYGGSVLLTQAGV